MSSIFVKNLVAAIESHEPLPEFEGDLNLDEAYALQHQVTAARTNGQVGGIKAGVTAKPIQQFLGLNHALIGSLYADTELQPGAVLPFLQGRMVECELAIFVDEEGEPRAIAPAIEFVYVNFSEPADMKAPNLVACNLGAHLYIVGDKIPWTPPYKDAAVTLIRNGKIVNKANMSDALGGPDNAAKWMWREAKAKGFLTSNEALLLTGACGSVIPCEEGDYKADYGKLGHIEFSVS